MKATNPFSISKHALSGLGEEERNGIKQEFYRESYEKLFPVAIFVIIFQLCFMVLDIFSDFYAQSSLNYLNLIVQISISLLSISYCLMYKSSYKNAPLNKISPFFLNLYLMATAICVCLCSFTDICVRHAPLGAGICFVFVPVIVPLYNMIRQVLLFASMTVFTLFLFVFYFDGPFLDGAGNLVLLVLTFMTSVFLRSYFLNALIDNARTLTLMHEMTVTSKTDFLTGASRRFCLYDDFDILKEKRLPVGVIMLDVDDFKKYNDTFSHIEGDDCLKAVSRAINALVAQKGGKFYRYGGEEFVALLHNISEKDFLSLSNSVITAVSNLRIQAPEESEFPYVTVSAGAAYFKSLDSRLEDLLKICDDALYKAKANGKNCLVVAENTSPADNTHEKSRIFSNSKNSLG